MPNNLTSPQYPIDPTGINPANGVSGELQALTGAGDRDYYFVVPAATPFFAESISLNFRSTTGDIVPLSEGVDYYLTHYFKGASLACAKPIYGSITFLNTQLLGTLIFQPYQTLGGEWTVDTNTIATVLAQQTFDPRKILWDSVAGYPTIFPPIPHEWNLVDMVGQLEILGALDRIVDAILTQATSAMTQHIHDTSSNPHGITPTMIGAVSFSELQRVVSDAMHAMKLSTDDLEESTSSQFFTEDKVLRTKLAGYTVSTVISKLADTDSVLASFIKLQAQVNDHDSKIASKADFTRPTFVGLGSQNLVKLTMTGSFAIDITQAEAFQVSVNASGAIGFNITALGDMTDKVIEFAVTTINDATSNAYAIAWPSNVKWVDGTPPPRTTSPNAKDYWYFISEDGGVSWTGSLSNANPR